MAGAVRRCRGRVCDDKTAAFDLKSEIQNPGSFIVPALIVCLSVVYKLFLLAFNAYP